MAAKLFLISALLTPPTILIHEFGHLIVPLIFGLPAELHPTSVSGGSRPSDPVWMHAAQSAGAPIMTLAMAIVGLILFRGSRQPWALSLAFTAISRMAAALAYVAIRLIFLAGGKPFKGNPNFDEFTLARIIGLNGNAAAVVTSLIFITVVLLLMRQVPRGARVLYFASMAAAVVISNVAMHAVSRVVLVTV